MMIIQRIYGGSINSHSKNLIQYFEYLDVMNPHKHKPSHPTHDYPKPQLISSYSLSELTQSVFSELSYQIHSPHMHKPKHGNQVSSFSGKGNLCRKNSQKLKSMSSKNNNNSFNRLQVNKVLLNKQNYNYCNNLNPYSPSTPGSSNNTYLYANNSQIHSTSCFNHPQKIGEFILDHDKKLLCQKCAITEASRGFEVERIQLPQKESKSNLIHNDSNCMKKVELRKCIEEIYDFKQKLSERLSQCQLAYMWVQKRMKLCSVRIGEFFDHCIDIIQRQKLSMVQGLCGYFQQYLNVYQMQRKGWKEVQSKLFVLQKSFDSPILSKSYASQFKYIQNKLDSRKTIKYPQTNCLQQLDFKPFLQDFGTIFKKLFIQTNKDQSLQYSKSQFYIETSTQCQIMVGRNSKNECKQEESFVQQEVQDIKDIPIAQSMQEWSKQKQQKQQKSQSHVKEYKQINVNMVKQNKFERCVDDFRESFQNPLDWQNNQ